MDNLNLYEVILPKVKDRIKLEQKDWEMPDLTAEHITKYAIDVSQLSDLTIDSIINKLFTIDIIRFGNFRERDSEIKLDILKRNIYTESVTSLEYQKSRPGAHTIIDYDRTGKTAICLFDKNAGNGIDLTNQDDIEQTLVHEFSHIMAYVLDKSKTEDVTETIEGRKFSNGEKVKDGILYGGISTWESNGQSHNQIDEGFTEYITRLILNKRNKQPLDSTRYETAVKVAEILFTSKGIHKMISQYFSNPRIVIEELYNTEIEGKEALHFLSDLVNKDVNFYDYSVGYMTKALNFNEKQIEFIGNKVLELWSMGEIDEVKKQELTENIKPFCLNDEIQKKAFDFINSIVYYPNKKEKTLEMIKNTFIPQVTYFETDKDLGNTPQI